MSLFRLLPLLAMLALVASPFGRMAAAEAMVAPHHQAAAMAGHCPDMPAQDDGAAPQAIDCMIACAAMAGADAPAFGEPQAMPAAEAHFAPPVSAGLHPESEPPPPRFS